MLSGSQYNSIPWSEVNPETLGVWQIWGDSLLNLAAVSYTHLTLPTNREV